MEAATVQAWKPAEAQGEEPVPSWDWGFLPGWLPAMLSHRSSTQLGITQARRQRVLYITRSRTACTSGLVRAFPR